MQPAPVRPPGVPPVPAGVPVPGGTPRTPLPPGPGAPFAVGQTPLRPSNTAPNMTPTMTPNLTPTMTPNLTPTIAPGMTPSLPPGLTPGMSPGIPPRPPILPSGISPALRPPAPPAIPPGINPGIPPGIPPRPGLVPPGVSPGVPSITSPRAIQPGLPARLPGPLTAPSGVPVPGPGTALPGGLTTSGPPAPAPGGLPPRPAVSAAISTAPAAAQLLGAAASGAGVAPRPPGPTDSFGGPLCRPPGAGLIPGPPVSGPPISGPLVPGPPIPGPPVPGPVPVPGGAMDPLRPPGPPPGPIPRSLGPPTPNFNPPIPGAGQPVPPPISGINQSAAPVAFPATQTSLAPHSSATGQPSAQPVPGPPTSFAPPMPGVGGPGVPMPGVSGSSGVPMPGVGGPGVPMPGVSGSSGTPMPGVSQSGSLAVGAAQPGARPPPLYNGAVNGGAAGPSGQRRYPHQPGYPPPGPAPAGMNGAAALPGQMAGMALSAPQPGAQRQPPHNVIAGGFNRLWGTESVDLMQHRHILPPGPLEPPKVILPQEHLNNSNVKPDIFRCTLTRVPETASILQKSRLPFGIVIHPFKDLPSLPVIQCNTIVRCRSCRTYINPFVYFIDQRRWKCNLCYRANDLPEEFQYDPVSKTYGDPSRRPECKSSTIEFIAPSEYMVRPPQPSCYLFVLDVSRPAVESGYLRVFCDTLLDELDRLPGDSRTQIGFITYDDSVHFYDLSEGLTQPRMMVVGDVDDVFPPSPEGLLVNLSESRELVLDLLTQLPAWWAAGHATRSCLGAALQAAYKLVYPVGGRITAVLASLPSHGPGALTSREDPNNRAGQSTPHLGPATDFYKKLALECSSQQVAVDLFSVAGTYTDLATLSGVSQFSGGCLHYYPGVHTQHNPAMTEAFERGLRRYLTRKIGFEAVMRIRCTRGLAMHTFHGNFFVRSTDLLSLPNVSPDAGFGIQVAVEEALSDTHTACFQAALLYTSSKGERRIRVHTLCLPVTPNMHEVLQGADQEAVTSLLAKMAVDRSLSSSLPDAREALVNSVVDCLAAYRATLSSPGPGLEAPRSLQLLPLLALALLKHPALRSGLSTKLDERSHAMTQLKCLPLSQLMTAVYPDLYAVHLLSDEGAVEQDGLLVPRPPRLHLSSESVDSGGVYLLDCLDRLWLLVGSRAQPAYLQAVFGTAQLAAETCELPDLETDESRRLRSFVTFLQASRPFCAALHIFREDSKLRQLFLARLVEDRSEAAFSYVEFLQHIRNKVR